MSMTQRNRPRNRGPIIAVLAVAVLALLLLVGFLGAQLIWGGDDDPQNTSSPTPSATTQPVVREDLKVTIGEGGSKTSPYDSSMPIGYEPTCKGAAEAATNYLVAFDPTRVSGGELSKGDYLALLKDRSTPEYFDEMESQTSDFIDKSTEQKVPQAAIEPSWGGFSVDKCDEGAAATIDVVYASSFDGKNYLYTAESYEMTWADDDWKIAGSGDADSPVELPEEPVTEPDAQIVKLLGTQSQWENYEDAD